MSMAAGERRGWLGVGDLTRRSKDELETEAMRKSRR